MTHPDVQDVQVVGVPDPVCGEELLACIVTRGGAELDRDTVAAFCSEHRRTPARRARTGSGRAQAPNARSI